MKRAIALTALILMMAAEALAIKPVQIYTRSLVQGQTTVAYSATVKAKYGTKPYTWSIGSGTLPTGLSIAEATGIISGTPTVNDTFNFVVHIVDSAGSPTSADRSLSITVSGSAPPPLPSVSITTTSMPDGIAGAAYSATLQATGGTAPYTWSLVSGALPPAATLTAGTGAIAGTLTASGTYNFTARVTDSSATPQTADRALVASIAAGPPPLFSDNFESGNFAAWDYVKGLSGSYPVIVQSTIKHGGTYAARFHYYICADSGNPACGGASQDINRWISKVITPGLDHAFTRGYLYFKQPEAGTNIEADVQRKLIWLSDSTNATNNVGGNYQIILTSFMGATTHLPKLSLLGQYNVSGACSGSQLSVGNLAGPLSWDTWYSVEIEYQLNTPGVSNGIFRVWIDGVQTYSSTTLNLRRSCTGNISFFSYGEQSNRYSYNLLNEYRYWDDIIINTTGPIGP